jgi:dTDP-glucose 4,6-dehydratase
MFYSENRSTILVTGGCGFIGSNFIVKLLCQTNDVNIVNLDALTYAGNEINLHEVWESPNYHFVHGRIEDTDLVKSVCIDFNVDGIINFAAESHVDRSIEDSKPFIDTNVIGTISLLNVAKELKLKKFLQVSTDEVYGSLELNSNEKFTEESQISPNSPYSSAKSAADGFVRSYHHTYGLPTIITRCSNNYGPKQLPEKLIPLIVTRANNDESLPVYGDGLNVRDWIHVDDHCRAIWLAYQNGKDGETYNIGADNEWSNIRLIKKILSIMGKSEDLITYVGDRLGHDRRYAIDSTKAQKELGWRPTINFEDGLKSTIDWYKKAVYVF